MYEVLDFSAGLSKDLVIKINGWIVAMNCRVRIISVSYTTDTEGYYALICYEILRFNDSTK